MVPLRVLVAEDDPDDRMFLEEAFSTVGGDVELEFAPDGEAALASLASDPHVTRRLVMADIKMPRMNGFELLEAMREQDDLRDTPVVMMSTSSAPEDVARAYRSGANTYFTKPARFQDLVRTVDAVLGYWGQHAKWPPARSV